MPYLAVMASIESLHRMTREQRDLDGLVVAGSDHLTAYNVYAEAFRKAGYVGEVYGLPRHLFDEATITAWAERRGVLVKAVEDAALAMASVCRAVGVPLPEAMPPADDAVRRGFCDLIARIMPFDLVIDEATVDGQEARVSKTSVCGSWGAVAGSLRYFADRFGNPRASIEGTQLPRDLVHKYAVHGSPEIAYAGDERRDAVIRRERVTYFGFELEREETFLDVFADEEAPAARRALAEALAREEARHPAVRANRGDIDEVRECYRRSGGQTPRLGLAELRERYLEALAGIASVREYRAAALRLDLRGLVDGATRARLADLPEETLIRSQAVGIEYDVEEPPAGTPLGVARLVLPEKLARTLVVEEIPVLDRPIRFVVHRGQRGSVRATTLDELQELLDRPWSPDEPSRRRQREDEGRRKQRDRDAGRTRGELDRFRKSRERSRVSPRRRGKR
jgi:ATP-dependent helicase HrpA